AQAARSKTPTESIDHNYANHKTTHDNNKKACAHHHLTAISNICSSACAYFSHCRCDWCTSATPFHACGMLACKLVAFVYASNALSSCEIQRHDKKCNIRYSHAV